ncbi:serine/threonine-protein kinase [Tundrisphaera lichenicola]|uniref:serine/threonine-protein kinase n=1 Tax=Tundrisphaera lichenicola TaxID=2029860 RepID=UPI003EBCDB9A
MSAKPQVKPEALDETIDYLHIEAGPDRPEGSHDMPRTTPQGQHRYTFSSGARPLEGYTIKRAIGRGGFGEVYYATSDSGKEVALKLITRNLEIERRGVAQCMNLKCPNLLAIHDIKTNDTGDTFVIMEYVAAPSLAHVLAQYPDGMPLDEVRAWLKGLVEGVGYLHDHGIVHRDLKPANLFMEEGVVKIADYGLSKMITSQAPSNHSESIGTCHYMAPEISTGKYNKPIDIYAIGVILYELITGRVPFEGESVGEVLIKHLTTRPDLAMLPEPFKTIIGKALAKDPAHRPSRVIDLLPPGDAPRARDVRFIGEGKLAGNAPGPAPSPRPSPPDDGILRITDEEPIHYIGPDVRPPRGRVASFNPWARRPPSPPPARRPAPPQPRPAQAPRAAQRVRLVAQGPLTPPEPPPTPPVLPSGRLRVAELAGSMIWAAAWSALLSLLAGGLMQIDLARNPQDLGYLFALTLAGSWSVLAASKSSEGKTVEPVTRRLIQLAVGVVVGLIAYFLAEWLMVEPTAPGRVLVRFPALDRLGLSSTSGILGFATFFGLTGLGVDWWTLTERDRKARFRIIPMAKAAVLAAIPAFLFFTPDHHPYAIPAVVLTSVVVQLASPWSEAAARYADYVRASTKKRAKVA